MTHPVRRATWMPDPAQTLLLHAALDSVPQAIEAWRIWRSQVDLVEDEIDGDTFRLLSLVYTHLGSALAGDPLADRLKGITRYQWTKTQLVLARGTTMIDLLQKHDIPVLVIKGGALIGMGAATPLARCMFDLDLLVPPAHSDHALRVLADAGWQPSLDVPASRLRLVHSLDLVWPPDGSGLDVHRYALADNCQPGADDALWAAAVPVTINGVTTRRPADADVLLHGLAHGGRWAISRSVRWVADAALLLRHLAGTQAGALDAAAVDHIVHAAAARAISLQTADMLAYLRDEFGIPLPAALIDRLRSARTGLGERLEHRMRRRQTGNMDGVTFHLHTYWRLTRQGRVRLSPVRYLCDWWGLPGAEALPAMIGQRVRRRLAGNRSNE